MTYGDPSTGTHDWALNEDDSRPFIRQAIEAGINFFDTANAYSVGGSEVVVGKLVKEFAKRDDVVLATKVHFPGASSMYAWQFSKALYTSKINGWARFVSMQPHYNLLYREEEREIIPLCQDQGVAVIPWSPLARGRLTKPAADDSLRSRKDPFAQSLYLPEDQKIIDVVAQIASERGVPMAQIALAWTASRPGITAPIIGATKPHHITDAVDALDIDLTEEEVGRLENLYTPRPVSGLSR